MIGQRRAQTGQLAVVYFASDHDPSGLDLQMSWEEALESFGAIAVIERIALTIEQVNDSALDIARRGIAVKPSDSRSQSYVAQYGSHCWEADVLPAAVIEQALDEHIRSWIDDKLWRRRDKEIEQARSLL